MVNPGSVGCPAYSDEVPVPHAVEAGFPEASYALIEGGAVTFRRIAYDSARMAARARKAGRPEWARAVATGWIAS